MTDAGMIRIPLKPGDLLLTHGLELIVLDVDHNEGGRLSGRRLNDGQALDLLTAAVYRVYPGDPLAPEAVPDAS